MNDIKMRLDNASNIYPASLGKTHAALFRLSVTLREEVNLNYLQQALDNSIRRIPTFGCTLSNGAFWWYLKKMKGQATVSGPSPLLPIGYKFHGGQLFKLSADGRRIVLDIFHALADGTGAQTFLLTVTAEYLRLRHDISISYDSLVLNPEDMPSKKESEDCFAEFSGKKGSLEKNDSAYHIPGRTENCRTLHNERYTLHCEEVKAACRNHACTVTELLTAAMVSALQEVHRHDKKRRKNSALKINVPVNLRPLFGGRTLRNYSSYVNLGVDVSNGYFSFEEIVRIVSAQKKNLALPCELEKKVAANVALENNFAVAAIPLFIKKHVIDAVYKVKGDKYFTHTLSNLGKVNLPEEMQPFVEEMDFILGRQRGNAGAATCIGYGDKLFFNISRKIVENDFESYFVSQLAELGISVTGRNEELGVIQKTKSVRRRKETKSKTKPALQTA